MPLFLNLRNVLSEATAAPNRVDDTMFIDNKAAFPLPVPWPVHLPGLNPRGSLRQFSFQVASSIHPSRL